MADPFIESRIKHLPIFQKLPTMQIEAIADAFEVFEIQPNDLIFRQGYPAQGLYVMVNGRGILTQVGSDNVERTVGEVSANQYVGEISLFRQVTETMSLRVIERAIILFLSRQHFEVALQQYPEIRVNLNSQYMNAPEAVTKPLFKGQRPVEAILMRTRRHPWSFLRLCILPILLGIALMILGVIAGLTWISLVIFGIGIVVPGVWIYFRYDEWNDDWITITDQRVIREENSAFSFETSISEMPFSSVHEVNFHIPPEPFALFFKYGTVTIKSAGQSGQMVLDFIPNPEAMQKVIFSYQQNYRKSDKDQNREAIRREVDRFLQEKEGGGGTTQVRSIAQKTPIRVPPLSTKYINGNGETVYRKHLSVWFSYILLPAMMVMAGLLLLFLTIVGVSISGLGSIQLVLAVFIMLVGGLWFYWVHWDWANDMYVVGDESIRIIHKRPLWMQDSVDQLVLSKIDNVVSDKSGLTNAIFNRGNVLLYLVGDDKKQAKIFEKVQDPSKIQAEISDRRAKALAKSKQAESQRQHQTITEYLDVYHERLAEIAPKTAAPQTPIQQAPSQPTPPPAPPVNRDGTRPPRVPRVRRD
jgi:Cyclic nucleotide-binding domain